MKLWHDDIRRPPDETWTWARTNDEAKLLLLNHEVEEASLDHDLGLHGHDPDVLDADLYAAPQTEDGYELVAWMIENGKVPPRIRIHSWNPPGAKRMAQALGGLCECVVRPF
jgi:hypothetical protein